MEIDIKWEHNTHTKRLNMKLNYFISGFMRLQLYKYIRKHTYVVKNKSFDFLQNKYSMSNTLTIAREERKLSEQPELLYVFNTACNSTLYGNASSGIHLGGCAKQSVEM